jgi:ATP-dependent Clp protease adaptor protein ClpS
MPRRTKEQHDTGTAVAEKERVKTAKPRMWRVILHNDDFTTQDFVTHVLETVFKKQHEEAVELMLEIHFRGACVAGVYTREVAETKVETVEKLALKSEFPFLATMEPDSGRQDGADGSPGGEE